MWATEQWANIELCVLLHKSPSETLQKLQEACGKGAINKTQIYELHKRSRDGRVSANDNSRCGLPSTSTDDANMYRKLNDGRSDGRKKNIQQTTTEVGISVGGTQNILHKDLNTHCLCQHIGRWWRSNYLDKHNVKAFRHPPYSPDSLQSHIFLFLQLQSVLKGRWFPSAEDFTTKATRAWRIGFQECSSKLYQRREKCVTTQGNYSEGNVLQIDVRLFFPVANKSLSGTFWLYSR
jgi:hypothetical protein